MKQRIALVLAVLLCAVRPAAAQPDVVSMSFEDSDGERTTLIDPRRLPVYNDLGHGLRPEITYEIKNDLAYDIVLSFENDTSRPARLGRITVGVITLGPDFRWLNLNRRCDLIDANRDSFATQVRAYPGSFYSPVGVLMNDEFAVGVSLLYDALQDRHEVTVRLETPNGAYAAGAGGPGYAVGFDLGNPKNGRAVVRRPGELVPGERREYRVAVRAVKLDAPVRDRGPQAWLACIEPYRDHFEALYGGVSYERDPRPVRGANMSGAFMITDDNPMGYRGSSRSRPDLGGWRQVVGSMLAPSGFERTMLWTPGGVYNQNRELNYPTRFMSQLLTTHELATAFDTASGLPRFEASGHTLGLWWGRASTVMRAWDTPHSENLDPGNRDHVALAMHEMRLAARAGASEIGLDAFAISTMPVWHQYEWVLELRRQHPGTKFITEPMTCDIMHTLGPTFDLSWLKNDSTGRDETRFRTRHPHYLADYLVPGHEIWGQFRYDVSRIAENVDRVQRDALFIASTGRVPVLITEVPLHSPGAVVTTPTWLQSVPDHLKLEAHTRGNPPTLDIPDEPERGGDTGTKDGEGRDGMPETRRLTLPNGRVVHIPVRG